RSGKLMQSSQISFKDRVSQQENFLDRHAVISEALLNRAIVAGNAFRPTFRQHGKERQKSFGSNFKPLTQKPRWIDLINSDVNEAQASDEEVAQGMENNRRNHRPSDGKRDRHH